ncbi:MAG: ribonuclease III family protein [Thermoproteota archaeon]|nr:hypothetical protein [Candidatus Brockarchaeota archaeon]MBO3762994.1 hypothetical protein [Candidatus Brockarchaeota archaeon]MBO3768188.1 hypothetical protein [Candidatus Brockarchaeota archaeon]MBO3800811.1 hypothetical protein [Candidatus Brockarchaeota archaeon]
MNILKELVRKLDVSKDKTSAERVLYNRDLAKIGDAILNYVNTLVVSAGYVPKSNKVTNKMLREVVNRSGLRKNIRKRQTARALGNIAEAIVAYLVLNEVLTEEQMVELIVEKGSFEEALIYIFRNLFVEIGTQKT